MNCDELRPLIDAYLDDELDLITSSAIARHLPDCPDCLHIVQDRQKMLSALHTLPLYAEPVAGMDALQARLQKTLRTADQPQKSTVRTFSFPGWLTWQRSATALIAILIILLIGLTGIIRQQPNTAADTAQIAVQVLNSHLRSLTADHLLDVVSTDMHTVKPWFNGKLNFSPVVIDLTGNGFPLLGGRLDYIDQKPVAALVYQSQKHTINVFEWPSDSANSDPLQQFVKQGYYEFYWSDGSTEYWVISDLNATELGNFVGLIQSHSAANDR